MRVRRGARWGYRPLLLDDGKYSRSLLMLLARLYFQAFERELRGKLGDNIDALAAREGRSVSRFVDHKNVEYVLRVGRRP